MRKVREHIERVDVFRGGHRDGDGSLFGPLPGVRMGDAVAYEFELPTRFVPWPGRSRLERVFVLLDLGVGMSNPCWCHSANSDGSTVVIPETEVDSWYVDLISVTSEGGRYVFRDLFIDVGVPTDGRHYRMLDLDEFADAFAHGTVSLKEATDGLQRWQRFLDRHLHAGRFPLGSWTDFPPASLHALRELPAPLGPPVRWEG